MRVIAEGVEDAQQVATLEALGIRYAQGYHFGRPAAAQRLLDRAA
ncbi:MAG TPA: EAL domain-containing protein [Conexibacter sp.]|nr:EAL domain-containing protein [Conexibacter sp.]